MDKKKQKVFHSAREIFRHYFPIPDPDFANLDYCYDMGRDCAIYGPNVKNCNFRIFGSREGMEAWERGMKDGEKE
jgi:hypothetical protein